MIKVKISIGANDFQLESESASFDQVLEMFKLWLSAQENPLVQAHIDAVTGQIKAHNDALAASVTANTPTP